MDNQQLLYNAFYKSQDRFLDRYTQCGFEPDVIHDTYIGVCCWRPNMSLERTMKTHFCVSFSCASSIFICLMQFKIQYAAEFFVESA